MQNSRVPECHCFVTVKLCRTPALFRGGLQLLRKKYSTTTSSMNHRNRNLAAACSQRNTQKILVTYCSSQIVLVNSANQGYLLSVEISTAHAMNNRLSAAYQNLQVWTVLLLRKRECTKFTGGAVLLLSREGGETKQVFVYDKYYFKSTIILTDCPRYRTIIWEEEFPCLLHFQLGTI